jgi:hypothetical protein
MTVLRRKPLPKGPARGRLVVARHVVDRTVLALHGFLGPEGRHEGVVFWLGRIVPPDTYVLSALIPECTHGPQFVSVSPAALGTAARTARGLRLSLVCQVHSHPGADTRHSDGDDTIVPLPSEGMFSLVVGLYGDGSLRLEEGAGLHQFQDGRWVQITPGEPQPIFFIPALLVP